MRPEELFENFDTEKQARYEAELIERYGERVRPRIEESKRRMSTWTKADAATSKEVWQGFLVQLAGVMAAGAAVDSEQVQGIVD